MALSLSYGAPAGNRDDLSVRAGRQMGKLPKWLVDEEFDVAVQQAEILQAAEEEGKGLPWEVRPLLLALSVLTFWVFVVAFIWAVVQ